MTLEEQAIKVLDESASDSESNIVDELVQEFPAPVSYTHLRAHET